jgi:hypothetical protein
MSFNVQSSPLLSALAHLFDHQEELPDDPVARLKRIGWVFAEKWYEHGQSGMHSLDDELRDVCNGDRGRLEWCPTSFALQHPCPGRSPACGWFLGVVIHVDSAAHRRNAKFRYEYHSPITHKEHRLDLSIRLQRHEFAHFTLKGQNYFWHFHRSYSAITWHDGSVTDRMEALHIVTFRAAAVTYVRYDVRSATSITHRLFTTSHESCVSIRRFRDPRVDSVPLFGHWSFYSQVHYNPEHDTVLNHNGGASTTRRRLEQLALDVRAVTCNDTRVPWKELPLLSERLSRQRRSRFVRIARTLLLARAQVREEARARDPVKKCAACAIEAVKSQLALGIESITSKRQRVSAA